MKNQNDRYLIKSTYLEGPHKGEIYILRKEGYVTDLDQYQWEDTTYASKAIAQRVCNKKKKDNDRDYEFERKENQWNINKGRSGKEDWQFLYWPESFEPIRVDPETDRVDRNELTEAEIADLESRRW